MEILLSENIKKFRTLNKITQEKLAEILGVSPQAVSRWENGSAYPDITLLPVIAEFFGITTDTLLGTDTAHIKEQISAVLSKNEQLNHLGKLDESAELLKNALREYPQSAEIAYQLALSLKNKSNAIRDFEERAILVKKAAELCERALELEGDIWITYSAKQLLCLCYSSLGDHKRAVKAAEEMPSVWNSREVIIPHVHAKHDAYIQYQHNLVTFMDLTIITLSHLARGKDITPPQCIELLQKAVNIADMLTGEDHKFCNMRIGVCHRWIAREYCKLSNADAAFNELELALKYARLFEERPMHSKYKVFWLSEIDDDKSADKKQWEGNEYQRLLNGLSEKPFDFIRNDERFQKFTAKVKALANA